MTTLQEAAVSEPTTQGDPDDAQNEAGEEVHGNVRESGEAVEEPVAGDADVAPPSPRVEELPDGPEGARPASWGRN